MDETYESPQTFVEKVQRQRKDRQALVSSPGSLVDSNRRSHAFPLVTPLPPPSYTHCVLPFPFPPYYTHCVPALPPELSLSSQCKVPLLVFAKQR